jgi:ABC-type glycerol-3-phosphate transport system substrate-binding protein
VQSETQPKIRYRVNFEDGTYIWLGEFVEKGLLTDITNYTKDWGRASDWYQANWDGGSYNDKIYGIWTVVDARGTWYWKDLLKQAGVNASSLNTWNGYIEAAKGLIRI